MAGMPITNPVGKVFMALSCDLRLRVLNAVNAGHDSTGRVAVHLGLSTSTVSKAVAPLVRAGLLARTRHAGGTYRLHVTALATDLITRALAERPVLAALHRDTVRDPRHLVDTATAVAA